MDIALFAANASFARIFEATDRMAPDHPLLGVCAEASWSSLRSGAISLSQFTFLLRPDIPDGFPSSLLRPDELVERGIPVPCDAVFSTYSAVVECELTLAPKSVHVQGPLPRTFHAPGFTWFDSAQSLATPDSRLLLAVHGAVLFLDVLPEPIRPRTLDALLAASGAAHRPAATAHAALAAQRDARPALALGRRLLQGFLDGAWNPLPPPRPHDLSL